MGLKFAPRFHKLLTDMEWSARMEERTIQGMTVLVPKAWSANATSILVSKYFRRAGVPQATDLVPEAGIPRAFWRSVPAAGTTFGGERDARDVFHRLAGAWTYWGCKTNVFASDQDALTFYNEVYAMLFQQMAAPNSPQWFNCFTGRTSFITREYGSVPLAAVVGEDVTVWTREGWMPATVRSFGAQQIQRITFAPAFQLGNGGWSTGKCNLRVVVEATPDHRWIKADGSETTTLSVGDVVPSNAVRADTKSDQYRWGFQHGVVFGDGTTQYQHKTRATKRYFVNLYGKKSELAQWFDQVSYPPFLGGDAQGVVNSAVELKELPSGDGHSDYLCGFLDGWIAVDGSKKASDGFRLSTIHPNAEAWLREHGPSAGWLLTGMSTEFRDTPVMIKGREANPSGPLHTYNLARATRAWKVKTIEVLDEAEEVFCAVVPGVHEFTLSSGITTGNCGLHWAYGITKESTGYFYVDPDSGQTRESTDLYEHVGLHACHIQRVDDDLVASGGIMDWIVREAKVFKVGAGSGANVSKIRAAGEPLSGGGKSSGLMGFLKIADRSAGAIKSGGTTRRAAKLLSLDLDHPDVEDFIGWKVNEEHKVASLITGSTILRKLHEGLVAARSDEERDEAVQTALELGVPEGAVAKLLQALDNGDDDRALQKVFDLHFEGEAYESVSGQNANNSLRVPDAFMYLIDKPHAEDRQWHLTYRTGGVARTVDARDLWDKMCYAAWSCADPGVQFDDLINAMNTCPNDGRINGANPCCFVGETLMDTSEGRLAMETLAQASAQGQSLPMSFSWDPVENVPVLRQIHRVWKSGETRTLVEVRTARGLVFRCTPEHGFLTRAGAYIPAGDLKPGTSLRKVNRTVNGERSGRKSILHRVTADAPNGCTYQNRWMWGQAHGPIPAGFEVHHCNGDPTDDRLSNLELVPESDHRSFHAEGTSNANAVDVDALTLVDVWDAIAATPRRTHKGRPQAVTLGRWNTYIQRNGLKGVVPLARRVDGVGRIRGMSWPQFESWIDDQRAAANDRVESVTRIELDEPVAVYDAEVDGVHNFGIGSADSTHSVIVHNSEYHFLDDTSCNLASLNLLKFYRNGVFDYEDYAVGVRIWTTVLDISVSMSHLPSPALAEGAYKYRNLGLGYANLGALLMAHGVAYDSDEGRLLATNITSLLGAQSYRTSVELSEHLGPFPRYEANKGAVLEVIFKHANEDARNAQRRPATQALWCEALQAAEVHGVRNAQTTLLAPTGTIGFVMDCDTTGVEPDFALVKHKQLVGGGTMLIANQTVSTALERLGYSTGEIQAIIRYMLGTRTLASLRNELQSRLDWKSDDIAAAETKLAGAFDLRTVLPVDRLLWDDARVDAENAEILGQLTVEGAPHLKPEHLSVFDCASRSGRVGTRSIPWQAHILMLGAVQPYLSGSVSKTINMPRESTVQDVAQAYLMAWECGVKCVAVYRDGSKLSAPMSSGVKGKLLRTKTVHQKIEVLSEHAARRVLESAPSTYRTPTREKLPDRRSGYTQKAVIAGHKVYLRTGEYPDGRLGEVFIDMHKEGSTLRALMDCFAIAISMGLQYGVPLERFVEQFTFTRFEPAGIVYGHDRLQMSTSILDLVFRDLAINYLDRHELAHVTAEDVRSDALDQPVSAEETLAGNVTMTQLAATATTTRSRPSRTSAQLGGYLTGDFCSACQSTRVVQNGKCTKCLDCGETSGCS